MVNFYLVFSYILNFVYLSILNGLVYYILELTYLLVLYLQCLFGIHSQPFLSFYILMVLNLRSIGIVYIFLLCFGIYMILSFIYFGILVYFGILYLLFFFFISFGTSISFGISYLLVIQCLSVSVYHFVFWYFVIFWCSYIFQQLKFFGIFLYLISIHSKFFLYLIIQY